MVALALEVEPRVERYFTVVHGRQNRLVPVHEACFLLATYKYIEVHTKDHVYMIEDSLVRLEKVLEGFVRVHRRCLVAERCLKSLDFDAKGDGTVCVDPPGIDVRVSRREGRNLRRSGWVSRLLRTSM